MKKIYSIMAVILASAAVFSCDREDTLPEEAGEGLKITVRCADEMKATKDGVGSENLIRTLDYFLFTGDGTSGVYRYKGRLSPNMENYYTFYIQSSFVNDGVYTVYTIANYPGDPADLGPNGGDSAESARKTLAELKALVLSEADVATFSSVTSGNYNTISTDDVNLVMTGEKEFTVTATTRPLVGTAEVDLTRVASKLTMDFYIIDQVERTNGSVTEVWTPMPEGGIRLYLCNGNESILLSGENAGGADYTTLFDYQPSTDVTPINGKTGFSLAYSSPAFYTYPESWSFGGHEEPYIKLIIPWMMTRTSNGITFTSQKEFYYKVVLPTTSFESNKWYNLVLDVTQLGSDLDSDAVNLVTSYQVANWGVDDIIVSSLVQGYYLDVSESNRNLVIYSDNVDIPFTASGRVQITDLGVSYENYQTHQHMELSNPEDYITLYDDYVRIDRTINVDYSGTAYDVSKYVFTFTLHLVAADTDTSYDKTVVVTQEPPLFINNMLSDGRVWVNGSNSTSTIWDNSGTRNNQHYLGVVVDRTGVNGNGDNNSQYIYEISATIVDMKMEIDGVDTKVVIGDPRGDVVNFSSDLTGITNYRPTAENTKNVIAPKIIFASSYGRTYPSSYAGAQRRCAAYQESGRPAGRWRLPTMAEVQFAIKLSTDGKIQSLFGATTTNGYWAGGEETRMSNGFRNNVGVTYNTGTGATGYTARINNTNYNFYTRCVYDSWYWGSDEHSSYNTSSPAWLGYQTSL